MPHSSGGGSSGGGFHGGSSHGGSSGPSYRTSSRYFPGAMCFVYYDAHHRGHVLYSNTDPSKAGSWKRYLPTYIALGIFMLAPLIVMMFTNFHNPSKLSTNYDTTITIKDELDCLSDEEEATLTSTFAAFQAKSGITPCLETITNEKWSSLTGTPTLADYAYKSYVKSFGDEKHWLLVYAANDANKSVWRFEGMQGNDTDSILSSRVTYTFNETVYNALNGTYSVANAFNAGFEKILPTLMDSYFYMDPGQIVFLSVWVGISGFLIVSTIVGQVRTKKLKTAVKVEGTPTLKRCPFCGNEYYEGTVTRCLKCNADLSQPRFAEFNQDQK